LHAQESKLSWPLDTKTVQGLVHGACGLSSQLCTIHQLLAASAECSQSMLVTLFTETGIMPLRIRRFLLLLSLAIWSISSHSNYLTLLVCLSKVQLNLWQLERSLGSGCAPCRGEHAILILDSTTRFGECYREKHVENWWKCALRNGCSRKSTNQTNSTCCTEDANLKRTNLPFKKPFQ
jgi:hypothetical protein